MTTNRLAQARRLLLIAGLGFALAGCQVAPDSVFAPVLEPFVTPSPSAAARDAFNVYDPDKRARAVALINASPFGGEAPYVRMYRLLIDDRDATVRAACAMALGDHGEPRDAELVAPLLSDESSFVRWQAARALQKLHNPAVVDPLIDAATDDEDIDVRMDASFALGQYPEPAVFDALVSRLNDRDYGVVHAAHHSLHLLTGQEFEPDPIAWLTWSDENRRQLFEDQLPYGYWPYVKPRGLWDRVQFWKPAPPPAEPLPPTGLDDSLTSAQ